MKIPFVVAFICFLLLANPAHAERFVANILLDVKCAGADSSSPICSWMATKNQVLTYWASRFHENARNLELIYDTDDDEIQVVRKSDGEFVASHMCFCDGATLANEKDTNRVRIAQIYQYADYPTTIGSAYGKISLIKNDKGEPTKFSWIAHFHFSADVTSIVSGVFSTAEKFIAGAQR